MTGGEYGEFIKTLLHSEDRMERVTAWVALGAAEGWVTACCATHDGIPTTDEEDAAVEAGDDICIPVLRIWLDTVHVATVVEL